MASYRKERGVNLKKVLFVATVDSHIRHFHIPYLRYFKELGYEVHVATANDENEEFTYCDKKHTISFERSPFKINNLKAIKQMKELLQEEKFDLVHCHTPMGGVVTRVAAKRFRKNRLKVFYTAHGFHFYKGAPIVNWLVYYPVERYLARFTDVLITINQEDYEYAQKFKAKAVEKIDGIGVDDKRFKIEITDIEKDELRKELSNDKFKLEKDDIVLTYVAELNIGKNQEMLINAMKEIVQRNSKIKLLLVGKGKYAEEYKKQIEELKLEENVAMTGYRRDVPKILKIADIGVSTSKREGLGLNLIEALLSSIPVVASRVRGHNEIVVDGVNGYMFASDDKNDFTEKIVKLAEDTELRSKMKQNAGKSAEKFILDNALKKMEKIYNLKGDSKENDKKL